MRLADAGIAELQRYVDTLIVIPNQNLFRVANERTTFAEAFGMADQVLHSGVRSITDLMVLPGLINLDFADVRTVMTEMGKAMMGTGEATGEDRALMAAENAIQNPLLDEVSLKGAKAVLVNVTGGLDMTLLEVDEAANAISGQVDPEANIIFGAAFDPVAGRHDPRLGGRHRHGRRRRSRPIEPYAAPRRTRRSAPPAPALAARRRRSGAGCAEPARSSSRRSPPSRLPAPNSGAASAAGGRRGADRRRGRRCRLRRAGRGAAGPGRPSTKRIVDPAVADAPRTSPLFAQPPLRDDRRQKRRLAQPVRRRPRHERARRPAGAGNGPSGALSPPLEPLEDADVEDAEDLEIPSFLRRLAN